jgi:hypothetical protein
VPGLIILTARAKPLVIVWHRGTFRAERDAALLVGWMLYSHELMVEIETVLAVVVVDCVAAAVVGTVVLAHCGFKGVSFQELEGLLRDGMS